MHDYRMISVHAEKGKQLQSAVREKRKKEQDSFEKQHSLSKGHVSTTILSLNMEGVYGVKGK